MILNKIKNIMLSMLIVALGGSLLHAAEEAIPAGTMHYLHQHHVNAELKERLDHFFDAPATYELLNSIYLNPRQIFEEQFTDMTQERGFHFYRKNVFSHREFPHFIFKFGYSLASEHQNLSRIRMAEMIRETAREHGLNITTPTKQAYLPSNRNYVFPLRIIIVVEKLNLDNAQELTEEQIAEAEKLENALGLEDLQIGMGTNVIGFGPHKPLVVIDTEPGDKKLAYPPAFAQEQKT